MLSRLVHKVVLQATAQSSQSGRACQNSAQTAGCASDHIQCLGVQQRRLGCYLYRFAQGKLGREAQLSNAHSRVSMGSEQLADWST